MSQWVLSKVTLMKFLSNLLVNWSFNSKLKRLTSLKKTMTCLFSDKRHRLSALLRDEDANALPRTHGLTYGKTPSGVQKKGK